jgi:hypothetical protein
MSQGKLGGHTQISVSKVYVVWHSKYENKAIKATALHILVYTEVNCADYMRCR